MIPPGSTDSLPVSLGRRAETELRTVLREVVTGSAAGNYRLAACAPGRDRRYSVVLRPAKAIARATSRC
jgi:hypothetical protein